ncbi:MAG TPA: imidazole glycerol phosphate synthase subunit HisH [Vicinamibacterales bacterium]|jgi:glutamine amidotransferase
MIVIIDYDMGNLGSILNMFRKLGVDAAISRDAGDILRADKLILPGVGAFDRGMTGLNASGLVPLLNRRVLDERCPVLGLCLGMQLMTRSSEEGRLPGLGWLDADTRRFAFDPPQPALRVPHMGWNTVRIANPVPLVAGFAQPPRYYFAHSYYVRCDDPSSVVGTTTFGFEFASIVGRGNVFGTQFHPEKSHKFGMQLLANFARC